MGEGDLSAITTSVLRSTSVLTITRIMILLTSSKYFTYYLRS